jgi:hypothetical protein
MNPARDMPPPSFTAFFAAPRRRASVSVRTAARDDLELQEWPNFVKAQRLGL